MALAMLRPTTCQLWGTAASQSLLSRRSQIQLLSTMYGSARQHESLVCNMNLQTQTRPTCRREFCQLQEVGTCWTCLVLTLLFVFFYRHNALDMMVGRNSQRPAASQVWVHHRSDLRMSIPVTQVISFRGQLRWIRASPKSERFMCNEWHHSLGQE